MHVQGAGLTHPLLCSITFAGGPGRDGIIDFTPGSELLITKAKNGHLAVVSVGPGQSLWGLGLPPSAILTVGLDPKGTLQPIAH